MGNKKENLNAKKLTLRPPKADLCKDVKSEDKNGNGHLAQSPNNSRKICVGGGWHANRYLKIMIFKKYKFEMAPKQTKIIYCFGRKKKIANYP